MHRLRPVRHEVAPQVLRQERHHRRKDAQRLHESVPERLQRSLLAVPEAPARAADVPVGEIVDIRLVEADHVVGAVALERVARIGDERVRAFDQPSVERLELTLWLERRPRRPEALDVRVRDEEPNGVPDRQQLLLDLLRRPVTEQQVPVGRLRAVLPAHHVGTHARERILRGDRVAPRAVHLAAVLVEHLLVAEHATERRATGQDDRHEELRVEPQADLLAHLGDPVRGEPLLPVGVVRQVGLRQLTRRTGRVALRDPLLILPAQRRERDDAGVEPDVADFLHALDRVAALLAAHRHAVDPRTAQLLELLEAAECAFLELRLRSDHVQVSACARIERQRQPVVAAARDVPVAHVVQPVVHPLAHVLRCPLDGRVRLEHLLPQVAHGDEPVVGDAEDQRRVTAPALGIAVLVQPRFDEAALFLERADDLLRRLGRRHAVEPAEGVVEAAGLVDRLDDLEAGARRDVHDARALVERDLVPRDHAMLCADELVERPLVGPADHLRAAYALRELVVRIARHRDPFAVRAQPVLRVRVDGGGDVRRQRPRRRRPDHERLALALA